MNVPRALNIAAISLTAGLATSTWAGAHERRVQAEVSGEILLRNGAPGKEAVVYLQSNRIPKPAPLPNAVVDQRDKKFIPHVSVVTVGTNVHFPNNDVVFHNVFTEYHSERFDLGMYPRGATKTQVFDRPGLAVLLCNIHPFMSAYVMCVDTPYYAVADAHGRFHMARVPDGEYTAHVWQEGGETLEQPVVVGPNHSFQFRTHK